MALSELACKLSNTHHPPKGALGNCVVIQMHHIITCITIIIIIIIVIIWSWLIWSVIVALACFCTTSLNGLCLGRKRAINLSGF